MSKKTKALIYNFVCFVTLFIIFKILFTLYSGFTGWKISLATFLFSFLLSPKFEAFRTNEGEKIFMKWLFLKGTRIIG